MGVDTAATERLPWLADEPPRKPVMRPRRRVVLNGGLAVVALVAIAALWISLQEPEHRTTPNPAHGQPSLTVRLPAPRVPVPPEERIPPADDVRPDAAPVVRPVPPREVPITVPPRRRPAAVDQNRTHRYDELVTAPPEQSRAKLRVSAEGRPFISQKKDAFVLPRPWNPRIRAGASGRLVEVGAFGSVRQAKRGWRIMVRTYPAMARLPAVVRPTRNSRGQMFFRFQLGTTSQAHSEILCQRMVTLHLSCAVVGLSWKGKVER